MISRGSGGGPEPAVPYVMRPGTRAWREVPAGEQGAARRARRRRAEEAVAACTATRESALAEIEAISDARVAATWRHLADGARGPNLHRHRITDGDLLSKFLPLARNNIKTVNLLCVLAVALAFVHFVLTFAQSIQPIVEPADGFWLRNYCGYVDGRRIPAEPRIP